MSTLLLRLVGPMQAWGTDSRFDIRFTEREPSKSGVLGMVCAALGKPRLQQPGDGMPSLAALAALRLGVRVDREGSLLVDYQTAGGSHLLHDRYPAGVVRSSGKPGGTVQSRRYYLADADFLVGLEGEDSLLQGIHAAVRRPHWQLCLGRKAFVPSLPLLPPSAEPGSRFWQLPLEDALAQYPWESEQGRRRSANPEPTRLRLAIEQASGAAGAERAELQMRQDVPLDFATRRFGVRFIRTDSCPAPVPATLETVEESA